MAGASPNSWLSLLPAESARPLPADDDDSAAGKVDRMELLRLIAAGDCGDERVCAWLQPAAAKYLQTGKATGALHWLGNLVNGETVDHQARNSYLLVAWDLVEGNSARQRASNLAREVSRFLAMMWPTWRAAPCAPEHASDLRKALFGAAVAGRGKLPTGWRQIWTICVQSRNNNCTDPEA